MKTFVQVLVALLLALNISAATFSVVNTNDSGTGSLRQAILDSNGTAATNSITFSIPGSGVRVISPLSALPTVTRAVRIDGFTQPGATTNSLANGNNANWLIELDGRMAGPAHGLQINGAVVVRGLRISNFQRYGLDLSGDDAVVAGCFIYSNRLGGIQLEETEGTVIGGSARGDRNVISGNVGGGIIMDDDGSFRQLMGNFIGTDVTGTGAFGNQGWGIHIVGHLMGTRIGGTNTGEGNVIAFNSEGGVRLDFFIAQNISIRGNRIFSNGGLGIDLDFPPGVSPNDVGDGDFGANQLQNFPLITNVVIGSITTTMQGRLNSQPNTPYALDFYGNNEGDISGHGEGEIYLGSGSVATDQNGNAAFAVTFDFSLGSFYVTATATDPLGNTSEFSPAWPQPLRVEFTSLFGQAQELVLRNINGSPIERERLSDLGVLAATNLSPQSVWSRIPNALELTNGLVRVLGLELTNGVRFFRSVEQRAPVPP